MSENNTIQIKKDLQQITDMLLLNGTLTECPGLVHGKMGIAIFFFHYAQYTNNMLFADYAMDLIDQILNQLHVNSPANYKKGIAGIGVGFDYMIRNNFLDIEDDICEDFDGRMYRAVKYDPWQDFSQYNGLTGYGRYWMTRLNFPTPAMQARECLTSIVKLIEEHLPDISAEEQIDVYCFLYDLQEISGSDRYTGLLAIAAVAVIPESFIIAPAKATPTDIPSGILCNVTAKSIIVVFDMELVLMPS